MGRENTQVKLLTRIYNPVEGQILWDGVEYEKLSDGRQGGLSTVIQQRVEAARQRCHGYLIS